MNVRVGLAVDGENAKVEAEAAFIRLLSTAKARVGENEVDLPEFARHVMKVTETVPLGRRVVLGRLGGTKIDEGRPDIVVLVRLTRIGER